MVDARLRFLDNASKSLCISSPAISAHLRTVRRSITDDKDGTTSVLGADGVCVACGSILLPGRTCNSISSACEKRTRQDRLMRNEKGVRIEKLKCQRCGSVSTIEKPGSKPKWRKPPQNMRSFPVSEQETSKKAKPPSEPSSKLVQHTERSTRRRPRNKKPSLHSMLADQKTVESKPTAGFGLDLMDLMKP